MRPIDEGKLLDTHQAMLDYQAEHYGQAADFRWLMQSLDLHTTSVIYNRMLRLLDRGLVVRVGSRYVAIT